MNLSDIFCNREKRSSLKDFLVICVALAYTLYQCRNDQYNISKLGFWFLFTPNITVLSHLGDFLSSSLKLGALPFDSANNKDSPHLTAPTGHRRVSLFERREKQTSLLCATKIMTPSLIWAIMPVCVFLFGIRVLYFWLCFLIHCKLNASSIKLLVLRDKL